MPADTQDAAGLQMLQFTRNDRVLVIAPHPDDESIACAGTILAALAAGAQVRVLLATDGDNNPWPQRRHEWRWSISAAARVRWGARRRAEADAALDVLGVSPAQRRYLGWPDQGLTDLLLHDGEAATARIASEIMDFSPTQVLAPSLFDTHPDHSALHILTAAALRRCMLTPLRYDFLVHGDAACDSVRSASSAQHRARKLTAIACHSSQLLFGRSRLERYASLPEEFVRVEDHAREWRGDADRTACVPASALRQLRGQRLLAIGVDRHGGIAAARSSLPRVGYAAAWNNGQNRTLDYSVLQRRDSAWEFDLPWHEPRSTYFKLEAHPRGLWIFDRYPWRMLSAQQTSDTPIVSVAVL